MRGEASRGPEAAPSLYGTESRFQRGTLDRGTGQRSPRPSSMDREERPRAEGTGMEVAVDVIWEQNSVIESRDEA